MICSMCEMIARRTCVEGPIFGENREITIFKIAENNGVILKIERLGTLTTYKDVSNIVIDHQFSSNTLIKVHFGGILLL